MSKPTSASSSAQKTKAPTAAATESLPAPVLTSHHAPDRLISALPFVCRIISQIITWGGILFLAPYVVQIVQAMAGKDTKASVLLSLMANAPFRDSLCAVLGIGGVGYGISVKRTYQKRIKDLSTHLKELETHNDPNRSTSGLTDMGEGPKF